MLCYGPDSGPDCGPVCGPESVDQTVEVQQVRDQVLGSGYIRLFFFWFKLTLLVALVTSAVLVSVTVQSFLISCLSC